MYKSRLNDNNWRRDPWFRAVCTAFNQCKNEEEISDLLRDIGTLSELQAWSERLEVAKQLSQGKTYRKVAENTGASTTTVTRVAKFLNNGEGGYKRYLSDGKQNKPIQNKSSNKHGSALRGYLERAQ